MDLKYAGRDIPWALPFGDHLHSTNSENNSNELKTIAHRYGFQAFDEQLTTSDTNSKWTNPGVVFTDKTIGSDLTAIQNTDFHDDHGHTFCYLCSINQHKHERTKPRDESKKRTLTPYKNPKARLPSFSSSDQIKQNLSSDFISYRFIVRTGTQKNSGTQAKVFLYLYGTESNWTSVHLQKHSNLNSSTSNDGFPSGSVRTFCFKGPNIGQLHHLNVNLVGSRSDKEWFLKEIEITNLNSATTWICEFNCWLPEQDEQQENEIKPNSTHLQTKPSLSMYILQIRTGEKSHTVNNGNAQIKIRGSTNRSGVLTIKNNRANLFERNQLDTFAIVGSDLGDLLEITAELDRSQSATDWHIKDMIIHKLIPDDDHKQSQIYFPFNICLSRKVNQFTAKKEICPSTDYHFKGPICYQVIMKTGNVSNARTDSDVFIMIYGKNGRTAIHQLNSRLNNDTERITASEFIIMDIDIGIIDRIKIWHENSSLGAAWFLESVIIRKKYSTCHIISNVYLQRIEHLCRYFYRQASEPTKKDPVVRRNLRNDEDHGSISHQSLKPKYSHMNGSNNRLENSRSILRSPTVYDKVNFRKKVSWDEQSIGSQDDAHSIDSQRMKPMQTIDEQQSYKRDSFSQELNNQTNHEILWISSHNFADNKWKIKSIEETNSFNLDSSTRTLLRSDRLLIDSSIQKSANEDQDEIYEFQANFWLKKDKPNDKLEAYLTPQSIHQSSLTSADVNIDSKKKHRILSHVYSDAQHQKFENQEQSKFASPNNLKTVENFPKSSSSHNLRLLSSQLPNASKTPLGHSKSFQENLNSPAHLDTTLRKQDESPRTHSAADKPAQLPLTPRLKSLRNSNDFTNPLNSEEELLARITTNEQSHHPRSTEHSLLSSNQHSKFRLDRVAPIISEQSSSMKLLNQPRSSTEHLKSSQKTNLLIPISANAQNPLPKTSHDSPNYSRPTTTAKSLSSRTLTSLNDINDCQPSSRTTEEELLKRITNQSSYRSQQSTNSLSPLTPRAKSTSNIDNLTSSSMTKREALLKMPVQSLAYSRSTMPSLLSSSLLSKSLSSSSSSPSSQFNNDFGSSLSRTSTEPTLRSKPPMRLNPDTILQKPMNNQVHHSAYGTSPSDDF